MKEYLERLPKDIQEILHLISKVAAELNMPAYLVGGFVRDLLLGVKNLDLDIVIEGSGITFAERLNDNLAVKLTRHKRFGTATLDLSRKFKLDGSISLTINPERADASRRIDIASARKEIYPQPACLPEVTASCLADDLLRRDFTINAMAIAISGKDYGKLLDIFEGKGDLARKRIRVLHGLSFIDDPTRILRAIRFEQRFRFKIEPRTLKLLKSACREKMLECVEPQRLRDELVLLLKEEKPLAQIKRASRLTGFNFLYPRLSPDLKLLKSLNWEIGWFKRNFSHRRQLENWVIYLIGLLNDLTEPQVKALSKKFAFTSGVEKRLLSYKKLSPRIIRKLSRDDIKASEVFKILEPLSYEVLIALKAGYRYPALQKNITDFLRVYNGLRPHIRGEDLRKMGFFPGPAYKKIFALVLNARLNGKIKTREEEVALIAGLKRKGSLS